VGAPSLGKGFFFSCARLAKGKMDVKGAKRVFLRHSYAFSEHYEIIHLFDLQSTLISAEGESFEAQFLKFKDLQQVSIFLVTKIDTSDVKNVHKCVRPKRVRKFCSRTARPSLFRRDNFRRSLSLTSPSWARRKKLSIS